MKWWDGKDEEKPLTPNPSPAMWRGEPIIHIVSLSRDDKRESEINYCVPLASGERGTEYIWVFLC